MSCLTKIKKKKNQPIYGRAKQSIAENISHTHINVHQYICKILQVIVMVRRAEVSNAYLIVSWNSVLRFVEQRKQQVIEEKHKRRANIGCRSVIFDRTFTK